MSGENTQNSGTQGEDLSKHISDGIEEVLAVAEIKIEPKETAVLVQEVVEKFISPLMIQRAAGATSEVSVTMNPVGGVGSAHSVKGRNALINVKQVATAVPANLPALANLYERHGIVGDIATSALAGLYLFPLLRTIATLLKVPVSQQAAAILMVMWDCKEQQDDSVPHDGLLERVNDAFQQYGWKRIDGEELISHLETLEKINSIERTSEQSIAIDDIRWRLKETVKITY